MSVRNLAGRVALGVLLAWTAEATAGDWPMARHDPQRSNATADELPPRLRLQWHRDEPPLIPAWPDQPKLYFDAAYDPIVLGDTLFLASPRSDSLTALDTETGAERWRYFADGPIRLAPLAWKDKVYCVSDDGCLHCLDAKTGAVAWKFRGAPSDRRILGNGRLISTWPARGGPVLVDGTVYFAAGVWPFMGIFLYALDAESGKVVWSNSGDGSLYMKQPHNADSFAAVAPQGHLVVSGDRLLIPGGRSVPAVYDRRSGKMLRYQLAENGKRGGGWEVTAFEKLFFNGGCTFETETEKYLAAVGDPLVIAGSTLYSYRAGVCTAFDLECSGTRTREMTDAQGKKTTTSRWELEEVGAAKIKDVMAMIAAGRRLFVAGSGRIAAYRLPLPPSTDDDPEVIWETAVEGTVARLLAADDKLFAVTREGRISCFGDFSDPEKVHRQTETALPDDAWKQKAEEVLESAGVHDGYCVVWGVGTGRLAAELARQSNLHVVVIDPSATAVRKFRGAMTEAGLYGERIAAHVGEPGVFPLPPYLVSLMTAECGDAFTLGPDFLARTFEALRPFGGTACFPLDDAPGRKLKELVEKAELPNARVRQKGGLTLLVRDGPLPGSGNWTHEHADAANTRVSRDQLVKAPLGLLWFGGPPHDGILPRHGHGPQPQVIDGRLVIEGMDGFRCLDIYTGRLLWEVKLPGVGALYNNLAHQPGANATGTNYISTADGIYVVYGSKCLRLDLNTGKILGELSLPVPEGKQDRPLWGYLNVQDDYLVAGSEPLFDPKTFKPVLDPKLGEDKDPTDKKPEAPGDAKETPSAPKLSFLALISSQARDNYSASKHLVVMDRHSGKVLWTATARHWFRHNATCIGGGRVYTIDRLPASKQGADRSGQPARIVAFDLKTGAEVWSVEEKVFGTWLSYSEKHDVLVEAGRVARDTISDEPKGMRALRGADGQVLWRNDTYVGPAMIHGDTILKDQSACDLLTGKPKLRTDPITGKEVEWRWWRNYGCNTPAASEHLLTFRSGAAGYFDLCQDGGTGNFGGFRSGCTHNLVVAGGVLTAPDYTRTCTCNYQNQASLALVPMPEAEVWTFVGPQPRKGPIARLGINFGAPGDRRADDGTLWLEYPSSGGQSPAVALKLTADNPSYFRRHSSLIGGEMSWVTASGLRGVRSIGVPLTVAGPEEPNVWHWVGQALIPIPSGQTPPLLGVPRMEKPKEPPPEQTFARYTVRLYFAEPDALEPGKRRFHVRLQGQSVLRDFDIAREAGGPGIGVVKEFRGVAAGKGITIDFEPVAGAPVLCGVEVVAEE